MGERIRFSPATFAIDGDAEARASAVADSSAPDPTEEPLAFWRSGSEGETDATPLDATAGAVSLTP
jgi:hypothetical protein